LNILVTGGAGFIGHHLVDRLILERANVDVIDNFSTGKIDNRNPKAKYIDLDIREDLKSLENNYDVIFHLAALARIQPSFGNPYETVDINTMGTTNICRLAQKSNSKLIYAGSSSFYAGPHLSPYSFSKWQGEEVCKMFSQVYGLNVAIARFFNVFGSGQPDSGAYATIVGIFEKQCMMREELTITGDGEQRRDFTHVDDIVSGLIMMSKDKWNGEVFNLGTGTNYSINELASMYPSPKKYIPKRPGEARTTLADISFSKDKLGYKPRNSLELYVKNWLEELQIK
tara:strand:+ start:911 stop:1765 length:855 start_codon:yes stop_codon:yes gene_type:complete